MRLLDQPIHKEAEMDNKEALVRILLGTGIGLGAGALGEYLTTGKIGWIGLLTGALLGTGTAAYLNPGARKQLIASAKNKLKGISQEDELGAVPGEQGESRVLGGGDAISSKPTMEQYYTRVKNFLNSGQDIPDEQREVYQNFINEYEMDQKLRAAQRQVDETHLRLQKDPKYKKVLEYTRSGSPISKLKGGDEDISLYVTHFANQYKQRTGQDPTPDQLMRMAQLTRSGQLVPEDWDAYMQDKHAASGTEQYPEELMAAQMVGGPIATKAGEKVMGTAAGKKTIEKLKSTPAGRKVLQKIFGKGTTNKGMAKLIFGAGGKAGSKGHPIANLVMDIPEFFVDPNTGEYNFKPGQNIAEQDRLMELRERGGDMSFMGAEEVIPLLPEWATTGRDWLGVTGKRGNKLDLKDMLGQRRNALYNMSAGALRGWYNPLTSLAIVGKRQKDLSEEQLKNIKARGLTEGFKSNWKAMRAAEGTMASELAAPIVDIFSHKKVRPKSYNWGQDVSAPTKQELESLRDQIANRRGYYEVDERKVPIQEYNKNYRR